MSSDPQSPRSQALRYISDSRFHRLFKHGELTFTYADVGVPSDTTILFMPGMFASRYLAVWMHAIAKTVGVRVLVVDRPGMGSSTPVPLEQRVSAWIDLVPALLSHLNIPHVALASHSAGMIYLLNTLHHCRDLLHPERPYVAFLAPWVNPTHSRITSMQLAQHLPMPAFSIWNQIPRFLLLTATPVFESSGALVNKMSSISGSAPVESASGSGSAQVERGRRRMESKHGVSRDVQRELETLVFRFMFEEGTQGANDEAMQCLWGVDDVWDFEAVVVKGTDHNSVMQETGLFERIFREAAGRS
ncbi:hypothetical protein P170DRAFT_478771 [Aspergillus steynii IBT 23096]|uniref:AB hydrolase-1 domain-containing protein n=1 Tax=Aspergillus steynii IBT 23096 TaxID=1392250 RepID=A0A2I2FZ59_9EURO|nr:uncharacterized protein P170DRAFT_478771 [Aspergillus steynii IBT 23096]PLB45836.1 hypothetical protein P170DRAFT_478771 [Aspergillus steynii IBT 23096]